MIVTETITIGDEQYIHTYSDAGLRIMRDGEIYDDAIDPIGIDRTYVEVEQEEEEEEAE